MSSTNRSNAREEHVADYYITPIKDIELFLQNTDKIPELNNKLINGCILDPCGGGNKEIADEKGIKEVYHAMSYPTAIKELFNNDVDTYDIRSTSLAANISDYLQTRINYRPDIIITNPPFNIATSIIEKAMNDVAEDGYVIMLLRLNFFGSKEREKFFEKYMPEYVFMHHIRIGFTDKKDENGYVIFNKNGLPKKGSTDSIEYAHFIFHKGVKPEFSKLYLI